MLSVSTPDTHQSDPDGAGDAEQQMVALPDMDQLLTKLRRNMVELILQGDDVTRQMWRMYTVFEEIFGSQKISSKTPVKPVVVGDRIQKMTTPSAPENSPSVPEDVVKATTPASLPAVTGAINVSSTSSAANTTSAASATTSATSDTVSSTTAMVSASATASASAVAVATASILAPVTTTTTTTTTASLSCSSASVVTSVAPTTPTSVSSPSVCSDDAIFRHYPLPVVTQTDKRIPPRNKINQRSSNTDGPLLQNRSEPGREIAQNSSNTVISPVTTAPQDIAERVPPTSNPLLDTIGALAGSNPDSDDSDLDIVYQQLRYRGRHRRQDQGRLRTQRTQRRHQQHFANSDPESTSYAGSNSIDSGYKSQCATPEVSDSLSAPEVRRSASDVSASDSSTTSGRPRSSDGTDPKAVKIKMGTRAIAGKMPPGTKRRQPFLESSMNDVTLDHLMYLRQSMRKDRQEYLPSSSQGSMPSSSASSTVREELSPTVLTDEEGSFHDMPLMSHELQSMSPQRQRSSYLPPASYSPADGATFLGASGSRSIQGSRSGRRLSSQSEPPPETGVSGSPTSDYLLSGLEYYDLDSVHDFPQRRSFYAMTEDKSRCSRIHLMAASKRDVQAGKHDAFPKQRKDPVPRTPPSESSIYGISRHETPPMMTHRSHHQQRHTPPPPPGADSKLTEAAIRVLQMIEDFRMEEAIGNATVFDGSDTCERLRPSIAMTSVGPHAFVPRFRRTSGSQSSMRPASTGSLIASDDLPLDTRSIASSSSYAASAEHHVYEEIMYDLVCERSSRPEHSVPPITHITGTKSRNRYYSSNPLAPPHGYHASQDHARMMVRSHKRRSNLYSIVADEDVRTSPDRFVDMEWNLARGRRDSIPPDYPV